MLENLELVGTGFAVVLSVLMLIWGACAAVGLAFTRSARSAAPVDTPAREAGQTAPGVPPHHMAAIAAAVAHTLGEGHRVTRVSAPPHLIAGWPMEGRIETFTAHRIRTDWGPTRPSLGGETPDILRGHRK
ncbi:Na+-transporting methylmalonyl-CoA/oxaloacetate decarboxylase gamma subunit [Rhodovulum iodosum]|uniref:Na+-transporting methylmalonyl-CoA/oxaloacetate decarboxylase gamma subunit n=1 Tax=Rhodovulum iodosum TaxID=68291 RepID=A0ABV3XSM2_9RHOB|nr:OadG family transporter subunit [Rhodovulum robiginosum]RSK30647.1 hypothetical protein EJA01_17950 [Rhodovulum robiginosum]